MKKVLNISFVPIYTYRYSESVTQDNDCYTL